MRGSFAAALCGTEEDSFVLSRSSRVVNMSSCPLKEIKRMVDAVGPTGIDSLVAHRGYHWSSDDLSRPLENTIPAYEYAWTAGVVHCECDVALTSDGHLIVLHDSTLERLALQRFPRYDDVTKIPLHELRDTPLKNGCRIPTLKEVLDTAVRIGPPASLVIEMKPDERTQLVASALCLLLQQNRHFIPHLSLVFSFHRLLIQNVNSIFNQAFPEMSGESRPKMMLLTKSTDGIPVETKEREKYSGVSAKKEYVLDFSRPLDDLKVTMRRLLTHDNTSLDGFYMLYHESLSLESSTAVDFLRQMSKEVTCGVWLSKRNPDKLTLFRKICGLGVRYVNTDFPADFVDD